MKKVKIGIFFFLMMILIMAGTYYISHDISRTYHIEEKDGKNLVTVKQYNGKVFYKDEFVSSPHIEEGKDTVMINIFSGNSHETIFLNVQEGKVSESFDDATAWTPEKVVYPNYVKKENGMELVVCIQDIYDADKYYKEIRRNFNPLFTVVITNAKFLNDDQLYLEYYAGEERKAVSEIIDL